MKTLTLVVLTLLLFAGCKKDESANADDAEEVSQELGNAMAGIDEAGGSTGQLAYLQMRSGKKLFARYGQDSSQLEIFPKAYADSCSLANTFSTCSMNQITRTFNNCTLGSLTFDGTVTLEWTDAASDNTCLMTTNGHSIERTPNWTMTGRRGATLTVTSLGTSNQLITRTGAGEFAFTNQDGIRRAFTAAGRTLFDFTSKVDSAMTITGSNRAGRILDGGNLQVTNNLTSEVCNIVPSNVTWDNTCNCAVNGSWSGTCSSAGAISVAITGCGSANVTLGSKTASVTFDRCY